MIENILKGMNPKCRKLIRFYLLEAGTLASYAAAEGLRLGTVYSQWHRCLAEMRKMLR